MSTTTFGFRTTALDVANQLGGESARGKVAVVTGGSSGIGVETVRALCHIGCHVILCARNGTAASEVAEGMNASEMPGTVTVQELDLADLRSVKTAADSILAKHDKIHFLILNAGVMACPLSRTVQGFELQFGTNHVGHFYFSRLLVPAVRAAGEKGNESRIVSVSSLAHKMGSIRLDDLNYETRWYNSWKAYGDSKLCNVLFARQLATTLQDENVLVYSLHPGSIVTNLQRHSWYVIPIQKIFFFTTKSVEQGAATSIYACLADDIPSGSYLADCHVAQTSAAGEDMTMAEKLWNMTEALVQEKVVS